MLFLCLQIGDAAASTVCADFKSHAERRACFEALAVETDRELDQWEARLHSRIALWDQSQPAYIERSLALLDQDRTAYRRYRTAHCELDASSAAGGNGAGDLRESCKIDLDRQRIESLKRKMDAFDLGD